MSKLAEAFRTIGEVDRIVNNMEVMRTDMERPNRLMKGFLASHGGVLDLMHRQYQAGVDAFLASQDGAGAIPSLETPDHTTDAPEAL